MSYYWSIESKIMEGFFDRDFIIVKLTLLKGKVYIPYYKSTGYNSKKPGKWFPCLGHLSETIYKHPLMESLIKTIYRSSYEELLKEMGTGWIVKFRGSKNTIYHRISSNDKYGEILENISKGISKLEEVNFLEKELTTKEKVDNIIVENFQKGNYELLWKFIVASNVPLNHPQFKDVDVVV